MRSPGLCTVVIILGIACAWAGGSTPGGWKIVAPGGEERTCADPVLEGSSAWIPAEDFAGAVGAALKIVPADGPVVFCRGVLCAPVALDGRSARREGDHVLVEAGRAADALGLRAEIDVSARRLGLRAQEPRPKAGARLPPDVGDPSPDLELPLLDGRHVRLSSFRGTRVLVQAWASW